MKLKCPNLRNFNQKVIFSWPPRSSKYVYQIRTKDPVDFHTCNSTCNLTRVPPWSKRKDLSTRFIDSSTDENLCRQKDYGWNFEILSRNFKDLHPHSFWMASNFYFIPYKIVVKHLMEVLWNRYTSNCQQSSSAVILHIYQLWLRPWHIELILKWLHHLKIEKWCLT